MSIGKEIPTIDDVRNEVESQEEQLLADIERVKGHLSDIKKEIEENEKGNGKKIIELEKQKEELESEQKRLEVELRSIEDVNSAGTELESVQESEIKNEGLRDEGYMYKEALEKIPEMQDLAWSLNSKDISTLDLKYLIDTVRKIEDYFKKINVREIKNKALEKMTGETKNELNEHLKKIKEEIESRKNDSIKNIETEKASVEISVDDFLKQCKADKTKLRIEDGGEQTFVITGDPRKGNTISLKNTIKTENVKTSSIKKEYLYEFNNVKINKEDLVNLEKNLEKNRSLFDDNELNPYAIEGTVGNLLKGNENIDEIDISDYSAVIRALEIVEENEELKEEE
ncbi:hypothetical protein GQ568_00280, partial [Patescibacteria group bacterium]|nr:hypothetical protein [Patescibacteria group bacterium]